MMNHEMFAGLGFLWLLLVSAIIVIPLWRICQRIGYAGPLGLLILIPFVNIALIYFIAFGPWKQSEDKS
ncbi:hypothetical protein [Pseudidiomarina homiensis]|uniref:Uncharacterized protein n=1 Tax=Pseudidiomarina homiensis TaxID=364198 RepID=A0A432Y6T7_9GAMM|nr:hypothetical protein [Pseudidiomarina homiensis]RUO56657.1 hypothetical protein CWI70_07980 [Pseudidiomarina homiensis]